MTITIHRPVWKPRLAIAVGLAALLLVTAIAIFQNTETELADPTTAVASAPVISSETQRQMMRLQLLQDNFLPPAVVAPSAWMRLRSLQDNFLPPAVVAPSAWMRLQSLQDNYLPRTVTSANSDSRGLVRSDDRTNQPR